MSQLIAPLKPSRRAPERHKQELINATLDLIAEIGIPETTVSRIIERAGLSRGMIHLHFGGKDGLLIAAAQSFSDDYSERMMTILTEAGETPVDVIQALIRADLSNALLNERAARLWHAFRGISNPPPEITASCGTRGGLSRTHLNQAFLTLARRDGVAEPQALARDATFGTMALLEGMCIDFLSNRDDFSREAAFGLIIRFVSALFPDHFPTEA